MNVFTDASFKDGVAGLGAVLDMDDGEILYFSRVARCKGSNHAEYMAAIFGARMHLVNHAGAKGVVMTDSQLIVRQFSGAVKTRSVGLADLLTTLKDLSADVWWDPDHRYVKEADALSQFARRRLYASS